MSREDKALSKFVNNPQYRDKVINKIHKEEDRAYYKHIKALEDECNKLVVSRNTEISNVINSR